MGIVASCIVFREFTESGNGGKTTVSLVPMRNALIGCAVSPKKAYCIKSPMNLCFFFKALFLQVTMFNVTYSPLKDPPPNSHFR